MVFRNQCRLLNLYLVTWCEFNKEKKSQPTFESSNPTE